MPTLTHDEVRHIARLARLTLSQQEVEKFTTELTSILKYVEMLQSVDTSTVEPTAQVTGMVQRLRPDELASSPVSPDALLATSPLPIVDHQIQTPSAHGA